MKALLLLLALTVLTATASEPGVQVAAFYFPNYHPNPQNTSRYGTNWTEWCLMQGAQPRFPGHAQPKVPAWGYRDEAQPDAMAQKIAAAADHGLTAWIFDWYWHDTGPVLERGLEQGFLRATNSGRLKFALMWANHDWVDIFPAKPGVKEKLVFPGPVTRQTFDQATAHAVKEYFSRTNYWRFDGRPFFSIYECMTLVEGLGGLEPTRAALADFRTRTKAAGFPDLHLNAIIWGLRPPESSGLKSRAEFARALGVDSVTTYAWVHDVPLTNFPTVDYAAVAAQALTFWGRHREEFGLPFLPNVSQGWDPTPRTTKSQPFRPGRYPYTPVVMGNSPADFRDALWKARAILTSAPSGPRVVVLNAWNEWTEGSYLEPDTVNGSRYLEAVREVFPPGGGHD